MFSFPRDVRRRTRLLAGLALAAVVASATAALPGGTASAGATAALPGGSVSAGTLTGPTAAQAASTLTMHGADISSLQRAVDVGARYYTSAGVAADPLDILAAAGVNYVRLRVWNNPVSGYDNAAKVLAYAKTVKAKGFKLLVDFHYSDTWADPGVQTKPAAWAGHGIAALTTDVYNYTFGLCNSLKAQGTAPDSVQIGNEINVGLLWNDGKVINNDFTNASLLLKAGYDATKACSGATQVIIHTADADSDAHARWFYDGIAAKGVAWDITGLSYYCNWHGPLANMTSVVADVRARYGRPVIIAETAAPFTLSNADSTGNSITTACSGFAATWNGQGAAFTAVQNAAKAGGAIGVFYWEPTWTAVPGNGWDPTNINGSGDGWDNMAVFNWGGVFNSAVRWIS